MIALLFTAIIIKGKQKERMNLSALASVQTESTT